MYASNSSSPFVLIIGDARRHEFVESRASLDRVGRVVDARSVDEAIAMLDASLVAPIVIVVAQSYPGEFSAESLDRLRRQAPLARIVGMLGSWCEGETRTGQPWPAAIRLYWHQWIAQAGREIVELFDGGGSSWSLPNTATDEERLLIEPSRPPEKREGLLALCVERFEAHDWLAATVARRGYSTVWIRPGERIRAGGVRAALFDGTSATDAEMTHLQQLANGLGSTVPIIALLDFPRIEDHDRALSGGASAVLSKPLLLDDLFWQLDEVLGGAAVS